MLVITENFMQYSAVFLRMSESMMTEMKMLYREDGDALLDEDHSYYRVLDYIMMLYMMMSDKLSRGAGHPDHRDTFMFVLPSKQSRTSEEKEFGEFARFMMFLVEISDWVWTYLKDGEGTRTSKQRAVVSHAIKICCSAPLGTVCINTNVFASGGSNEKSLLQINKGSNGEEIMYLDLKDV
ncbi:hypothetical protein EKO27_g861 [Xylaria grammica]|uniref:Uncharacterized protein n=1 Tax=Xylaria grammica TaxID=363999 RepID=A0A439DIK2_9PEZI|nr:hypothetical protein EKO27_g861 [Xylaria grammica]